MAANGYGMATSSSKNIFAAIANQGNKTKDEQLMELCRASGERKDRTHTGTGAKVDIYILNVQHETGYAYLYVNDSTEWQLEEDLKFNLEGLHVVGHPSG